MVLTVFAASFLASTGRADQDEPLYLAAEKAVILSMDGDVDVKIANTDDWVDAAMGLTLSPGDALKTDDDSWVEIGFGKDMKSVLRIREDTHAEFVDLEAGIREKTRKIEIVRDSMEQIKKGQEGTEERKDQEEIERRAGN